MKTISLQGSLRKRTGSAAANRLRSTGFVPCNLYGVAGNVDFRAYLGDLTPIIQTNEKYKVLLNVDGKDYEAVIKEVQYHPLSDDVIHVDFHQIPADRPIKLDLPIRFEGNARGVREGGRLIKKLRKLRVRGMANDIPDAIMVNVERLSLGRTIKVKDLKLGGLEVLNAPNTPLATVEVPRAMRGMVRPAGAEDETEGQAEETAAE